MSKNRTTRLAATAVATTLAAGVLTMTVAPGAAHATLPAKATYTMLEGQTKTFGNVTLKVGYSEKLGEADIWETKVTVCNKRSEPIFVGPDTFSYTGGWRKGYMVTRQYQPRETYLNVPLKNAQLLPGKCVTGALGNTDHEPSGISFHNLVENTRINVLGGMPGEATIPFGDPRATNASGYYGDYTNDKVADVQALSRGKVVSYRTIVTKGQPAMTAASSPNVLGGDFRWIGKAGDLDGNGVTDLLLLEPQGGSMRIQYMAGGNRASAALTAGYGFDKFRLMTVLDDVNRDRRPELIAIDKAGYLYGHDIDAPRIAPGTKIGHGWGGMRQLFSPGDFNRDGVSDLIGVHQNGNLYLYTFNKSGQITSTKQVGRNWGRIVKVVSPGDMNKDGRRDMAAISHDGHLYFYANMGGRWAEGRKIGTNWAGLGSMA